MPSRSEGNVSTPLLEAALDPDHEGDVPLSQAERRAILERLRQLEQQLDDSRDENRRLKEELRRYKSTLHLLAPDAKTAEAWGVPTTRVFYPRRVREDPSKPAGG